MVKFGITDLVVYHSDSAGWPCWTRVESLFHCFQFWLCFLCFVLPDKLVYLHFISSLTICFEEPVTSSGSLLKLLDTELCWKTSKQILWLYNHNFEHFQLFLKNRLVQLFLCILKVKWPVLFFLLRTMRQVSESMNSTVAEFKTFYLYSVTKWCSKTVLRSSLPVNDLIILAENHVNSVA